MVEGFEIDPQEEQKRNEVIQELKQIESKLNISFYDVRYIMNELELDDCLGDEVFN